MAQSVHGERSCANVVDRDVETLTANRRLYCLQDLSLVARQNVTNKINVKAQYAWRSLAAVETKERKRSASDNLLSAKHNETQSANFREATILNEEGFPGI